MKLLARLILCLSLAACAPAVYQSPVAKDFPESSLARLAGASAGKQNIYIEVLDGENLYNAFTARYPQAAKLVPGRHQLTARYEDGNMVATSEILFDAEAGKNYSIRKTIKGYAVIMWIEELEFGTVVSGPPGAGKPAADKGDGSI